MRLGFLAVSLAIGGLSMATATSARASVTIAATPAPVKCAIPKPCATFTNTSSGPGLEAVGASGEAGLGVSSGGAGLIGLSGSGNFLDAGIDGESYNASGNDAGGVFGADFFANGVAPTYGAVGIGAPYGLLGLGANPGTSPSSYSYGVLGQDDYGTASADGDFNAGVAGQSTVGTGVLGESNGSPQSAIFGGYPAGMYSVANSATGTPEALAFAYFGETNSYGVFVTNPTTRVGAALLDGQDFVFGSASTGNVTIDYNGDEILSGKLTTAQGTYVRTRGASGTTMMEYGPRTTLPQVEDVGEAQLANGRAYVTIDARLGDTIDHQAAYHVFVTPEGDCKGLYVTQKTPAGFVVRELQGGRSSLAFEYRIVAKPLDENGARLAIAPPPKKPLANDLLLGRKTRRPVAPALSPQDRLKRSIGTQAYAEEMLNFRVKRQAFAR